MNKWTDLAAINLSESRFFFAIVVMFYLVVAYFSSGYHQFDEHFQIVEFANFKLGKASQGDLAWEFQARIRPTLQPILCYIVFRSCGLLGLENPYLLAFILRAITALLAVYVIRYFICSFKESVQENYRNIFVVLSYFLWFLPYVNVRFSSETWSGLFFLLGLALIVRKNNSKMIYGNIILGAVLGLSILFRFQTAIMIFGLFSWIVFFGKIPLKNLTISLMSVLVIILAGIGLDFWFYGDLQITAYNYAYTNIVKDVASQFGTSPWYEILYYIFYSTGPFGILIIISYISLMIYDPKNILIWSTLPFLFVHAIIPHKELRFLFPLVNLIPTILISGFQWIKLNLPTPAKPGIALAALFLVMNAFALYSASFRGAGNANIAVGQFINQHYSTKMVNIICVNGANPYIDWARPKDTFYSHPGVHKTEILTVWEPHPFKRLKGFKNLLVINHQDITGPRTEELLRQNGLKLVFQNFSPLQQLTCTFYDAAFKDNMVSVYEL